MRLINPYISGPPIQYPEHFYGRREAVGRIFNMLSGPQLQSLMLLGLRRAGKTSLLNYISHPHPRAAALPNIAQHSIIYINLQAEVRSPDDFYNLLAQRLLDGAHQPPSLHAAILGAQQHQGYTLSLIERLLEAINRKTTILLDEFEVLAHNPAFGVEFFNGLRSLIARYPLAWITASYRDLYQLSSEMKVESSPFFNIFNQAIYIGCMNDDDIHQLVIEPSQRADRPFTPDDAIWIEHWAGALPCFIQKATGLLFEAQHDDNANLSAAREATLRTFAQWAAPHFEYYWRHFTDQERMVLTYAASAEAVDWNTYCLEQGRTALDALTNYGILTESHNGYVIRGHAFEQWINMKVHPVRTFQIVAPYLLPTSLNGDANMIELAQVNILTKAVEFLFDQVALILDERRKRRQSQQTQMDETAVAEVASRPGEMLTRIAQTKAIALSTPIREAVWNAREAEVKHLVSLIEIQTRNYWLLKEQYARWGSALVPQIISGSLVEAEDSVIETAAQLDAILAGLIQQEASHVAEQTS